MIGQGNNGAQSDEFDLAPFQPQREGAVQRRRPVGVVQIHYQAGGVLAMDLAALEPFSDGALFAEDCGDETQAFAGVACVTMQRNRRTKGRTDPTVPRQIYKLTSQ
jgi:hypothetical protein